MNKIVVDANVIVKFVKDDIKSIDPQIITLNKKVAKKYIITFDNRGFVETECIQSYNPTDFTKVWISEKEKAGKIKRIKPYPLKKTDIKPLLNKYGFPRNDILYINLANSIPKRYIISEDMDFYDPKSKNVCQKTKTKIINDRAGKLCKYLKKEFKIIVANIYNANNEL